MSDNYSMSRKISIPADPHTHHKSLNPYNTKLFDVTKLFMSSTRHKLYLYKAQFATCPTKY